MISARPRRLGERIDGDTARIHAEAGAEFEQHRFGVLKQLALNGPAMVGELAATSIFPLPVKPLDDLARQLALNSMQALVLRRQGQQSLLSPIQALEPIQIQRRRHELAWRAAVTELANVQGVAPSAIDQCRKASASALSSSTVAWPRRFAASIMASLLGLDHCPTQEASTSRRK